MKKKKRHIVLVEDEEILANLIHVQLTREGYEVTTIKNGKDGLRSILETKHDLLLLDIALPGLSGFDILEELHKQQIVPRLPVIIISNSGQSIEIERAKKLGIWDYLIKVNFTPQEVIKKVERVFEQSDEERVCKEGSLKDCTAVKKVLIVEDEIVLIDALERKFAQKNYAVQRAMNAQEARVILNEKDIDVILLDLILPDVTGLSFLTELKQNIKFKNIPVVIVSNLGQQEEIQRGMREGALDYIVKADTLPGEIVERVETIFKQHKM
jgi:DNA-binding response OmpR family regulator